MLIADTFPTIRKDADAHRAIALKLEKEGFLGEAIGQCEQALQLAESPISHFQTAVVLAGV